MDTDPEGTFDYIFYKGPGASVITSQMLGGRHEANDPTIYGSDHFSLVTEFEISTLS